MLDYLAAGFDPERSVCFLQSQVPQLAELAMILSNLVFLPELLQNTKIKKEMGGLEQEATYGFVGYPVSQAADILLFRPAFVPVGEDQRPHVDLARDVALRFNQMYGAVFPVPEGMYGVLSEVAETSIEDFRERRIAFAHQPDVVRDILNLGSARARIEGQRTLEVVKDAMGLCYRGLVG